MPAQPIREILGKSNIVVDIRSEKGKLSEIADKLGPLSVVLNWIEGLFSPAIEFLYFAFRKFNVVFKGQLDVVFDNTDYENVIRILVMSIQKERYAIRQYYDYPSNEINKCIIEVQLPHGFLSVGGTLFFTIKYTESSRVTVSSIFEVPGQAFSLIRGKEDLLLIFSEMKKRYQFESK